MKTEKLTTRNLIEACIDAAVSLTEISQTRIDFYISHNIIVIKWDVITHWPNFIDGLAKPPLKLGDG